MIPVKNNETFQRIEKKYILNQTTYQIVREKLEQYMKEDAYGLDTICNIYYDTPQWDLIRRSLEKPRYKEKLRIRSYGVPREDTRTFVEIKKKYDGVVYKRRIELPMKDTRNYVNHGIEPFKRSQIQREIDYFLSYYKPVPKMFIGYDRIAMYGIDDPALRLTFDFQIRYRKEELDLTKGDYGKLLLEKDQVLMEIKVPGAYPLWMSQLLDELDIYPVSFSKYGTAYMQELEKYRMKKNSMNKEQGENKKCLTA